MWQISLKVVLQEKVEAGNIKMGIRRSCKDVNCIEMGSGGHLMWRED
jgi:hypothetical protein